MEHDIRVTFHTDGQTPDSGRVFVEKAIDLHPGKNAINTLRVEHNADHKHLLRECLPYIEEVCEAEPVGGDGDNCAVNRAASLRDQIYSILSDVESRRRRQITND